MVQLHLAIAPDPNPLERDTQMCNLTLLFHVFIRVPMYQAYQNRNQHRLSVHNSLNGERERERERGMDALNSTKPDDHQVVSPTRVLLHLSILSINIGFTLSCHFFYNFLLEVAV